MGSIKQVQQKSIELYIKNLQFFEKNYPELFQKVTLLDIAINEKRYEEKFILEYKENYFDVKIKQTGDYLYAQNSFEYSKKILKYINKSKEDKVIEGIYRHYFTKDDVKRVKELDPTCCVESCVLPIVDFVDDYVKDKKYLKQIKKFIFFGVGLGLHLPLINDLIKDPAIYFIVEKDLELFRLSLFVTDYTLMLDFNNVVFFSVAESEEEMKKSFDNFFEAGYLHNSYLKYFMFLDSYKKELIDIQKFIVMQSHMGYTYDRLLKKYIMALKPIKEEYRFLNIKKHFSNSFFEDKPVLVLAAGPSLKKNIKWLKENQDKFIIVSVFMILPFLKKEGVVPDVVVHIDEQDKYIKKVLDEVDLNEFAKNSIFIFSPSINFDLFKKFDIKNRVFLIEDRTHYKIDHGYLQASSVGETSYALSLIFNAKQIYLLGIDLAFDSKSGQSHISEHGGGMSLKKSTKNVSLRETFFKIKGNFEKEVTTNPLFYDSILMLNHFTKTLKNFDQKVYNLSNGAYFEGIIPLRIQNIEVKNSLNKNQNFYRDLNKTFYDHSSLITKEEIELFKIRYKNILNKKRALEKFKKLNIKNQEEFINKTIKFFIDISITKANENLAQTEQVLSIYLRYVGPYIAEFANTAGLNLSKKDYKNFQNIISHQIYRILTSYQEAIKEYVL